MIVYREQRDRAFTATLLDRIDRARGIDLLIEMGELEAAVVDALPPGEETIAAALRKASLQAVSGAVDSELLRELPLPASVERPVSEGFAYYALDPDQYRRAAIDYWRERRPDRVAVIGIRSIGTSLSAVVAEELASRGCHVRTWTVRPTGHPWDRRLELPDALAHEWRRMSGWQWAVVDEGPGMSGTSFTSVAECLAALGVADSRIALFPSWHTDGASFVSERARDRWHRHQRYVSGSALPHADARELGAGEWRQFAIGCDRHWPAVQPQHERRKFLHGGRLYKFAGYGRYGETTMARATALAEASFSPAVLCVDRGYTSSPWLDARPVEAPDETLLDRIAAYLAFVRRMFPAPAAAPLEGMVRVNVEEGLGMDAPHESGPVEFPVYPDGRMLPHEWLADGGRYWKSDACDHNDDHFYPGPQDIAWDVAAAEVEFDAECMAERYARASGDWGISRRLPFYRRAYLAFRLGYADMAAQSLAGTADGARFASLRTSYAERLRRQL